MGTSAKLRQNKNNSASEASGDFNAFTQAMVSGNISDLNIEPTSDYECTQAMSESSNMPRSDSEDISLQNNSTSEKRYPRRGGIRTVVYKPCLPPIAPLPIPPFQNEINRATSSRKRQNISSNNLKREPSAKLMKKDLPKQVITLDDRELITVQKSHHILCQTDNIESKSIDRNPEISNKQTDERGKTSSTVNIFNFGRSKKRASSAQKVVADIENSGEEGATEHVSRKSAGWTALRRFRSLEPITRNQGKSPVISSSKSKLFKKYRIGSSSKLFSNDSPGISKFRQLTSGMISKNRWSRRRSDSLILKNHGSSDSIADENSRSHSSRKKSASPHLRKQRSSSYALKWPSASISKKRSSSISKKSPSCAISGENNCVKLIDFVHEASTSFTNQLPPVPPAQSRNRLSRSNTCKFIAPIKTFLSKNRLNKFKRNSLITTSYSTTPRKRSKESGSKSPRWSIGSNSKSPAASSAECFHCSGCGEKIKILSGSRLSPPVGRHPDCSIGEDQRSATSVQEMWGTTTSYWQAEDPGDSAENLIVSSGVDDVCFVPDTNILELDNVPCSTDSVVAIIPETCQDDLDNNNNNIDEAIENLSNDYIVNGSLEEEITKECPTPFIVGPLNYEEIQTQPMINQATSLFTQATQPQSCLDPESAKVFEVTQSTQIHVPETNIDEIPNDANDDPFDKTCPAINDEDEEAIPETPDKTTTKDSVDQQSTISRRLEEPSEESRTLDLLLSQLNKENITPKQSEMSIPKMTTITTKKPLTASLPAPSHIKQIFLTSSCLNSEQNMELNEFVKKFSNIVKQSSYIPNMTTHVIMSGLSEKPRVVNRTLKFFLAVMDHAWLVNTDWIRACLKAGYIVDESNYEIQGDAVCGEAHCGPKRSRLFKQEKNSQLLKPLFANTAICLLSQIANLPEKEFKTLVTLGGGTFYSSISTISKSHLVQRFLVVDNSKEFPSNLEQICRQNRLVGVTLDWFYNTISTYERIPINESSALFQKPFPPLQQQQQQQQQKNILMPLQQRPML